MEAFNCQGLWWLPDDEGSRVAGILRVSAEGELTLSLIGALPAQPLAAQDGQRKWKRYPLVLGTTDAPQAGKITLNGCAQTGARTGSSAPIQEEYRVQRAFLGTHLRAEAEITFRHLVLRMGGLLAWAHPLSGFRHGGLAMARAGEIHPLLSYTTPAPLVGQILGGELSLGFTLTSHNSLGRFDFAERPDIVVTLDAPLGEAEIRRRFINPLQNLMTLICDRPQAVERVSLWREDVLGMSEDNPEVRLIAERMYTDPDETTHNTVRPHRLLFTVDAVQNGFGSFIDRWLELSETYTDALDIFFGLQYDPPAFLDLTLLGVLQALRLYYSRRPEGVAQQSIEGARLSELLERLPGRDSEWLRRHLGNHPAPLLQDSLGALLAEQADLMGPLLPAGPSQFVAEVSRTVEFTIRRILPDGEAVSRGADLYWMIARLRILFSLCILRELGFTPAERQLMYSSNATYQHIRAMQQPTPDSLLPGSHH